MVTNVGRGVFQRRQAWPISLANGALAPRQFSGLLRAPTQQLHLHGDQTRLEENYRRPEYAPVLAKNFATNADARSVCIS